MKNLYDKNGLIFWDEREINNRNRAVAYFVQEMDACLKSMNNAFTMIQVEAPLLTPRELINPQYTKDDIYAVTEELVLRPETTIGTYEYAKYLLSHNEESIKYRMPVCVWQFGKSFRNEQDKTARNMRLKEFYQLEFQIIYANNTKNDYSSRIIDDTFRMIQKIVGSCVIEPSDRLPTYAEWTEDIILENSNMELCSISKRKDFELGQVIEVAIGMDRIIYNF